MVMLNTWMNMNNLPPLQFHHFNTKIGCCVFFSSSFSCGFTGAGGWHWALATPQTKQTTQSQLVFSRDRIASSFLQWCLVSFVHIFQACQELFLSGSFFIWFGVTTRIISSVHVFLLQSLFTRPNYSSLGVVEGWSKSKDFSCCCRCFGIPNLLFQDRFLCLLRLL